MNTLFRLLAQRVLSKSCLDLDASPRASTKMRAFFEQYKWKANTLRACLALAYSLLLAFYTTITIHQEHNCFILCLSVFIIILQRRPKAQAPYNPLKRTRLSTISLWPSLKWLTTKTDLYMIEMRHTVAYLRDKPNYTMTTSSQTSVPWARASGPLFCLGMLTRRITTLMLLEARPLPPRSCVVGSCCP